ncbi:MAG: hypothetical protein GY702_18690 [Desulfobulbaceae bacterium]|nr:hypothetical protein [Desulfobulbaceae bacterium]
MDTALGSDTSHIIDPRPKTLKKPLLLAERTTLENIRKKKLFLLDNTKLDIGNYSTILTTLQSSLEGNGFQQIELIRKTIRGKNSVQIEQMAKDVTFSGYKSAILTLGDMGVSPGMVLLTIALEKAGVPTVCVTAGPGAQLAKAVAYYRAGRLCLVGLDVFPGSSDIEVEAEITQQVDTIISMLCTLQGNIESQTHLTNHYDTAPPSDNGFLEIRGCASGLLQCHTNTDDYLDALYEQVEKSSIGDGLPVIPPTEKRVRKMEGFSPLKPHHVFCTDIGPSGSPITVEQLAINSVMAGCKPEFMPVLTTAMTALCDPAFNLFQAITTSHGGGNLLLISGPLAEELGINSSQGCLGPGTRANATIGRAINLTLRNSCRVITGFSDLACLSSPAEYSYCFAENIENSPWDTINAERYDGNTTTVSVLMAEAPHNVMDFASTTGNGLLETIADCCTTLGSNNGYLPGNLLVVLTPDHAQLLVRDGYDKESIRGYLHHKVGNPTQKLTGRGLVGIGPKRGANEPFFKATRCPEDIEIVVAGGKGGHSCVIRPWSLHSNLVVQPILLPDGSIPKSINNFEKRTL